MSRAPIPEGYIKTTRGRVTVLALECFASIMEEMGVFDTGDPRSWKGVSGTVEGGRAPVTRIRIKPDTCMMVKPLNRGGLIRLFNPHLHFTMGRIFHQAALSGFLIRREVPTAPMLLGRAERTGTYLYKQHLGTLELEGAFSLFDLLLKESQKHEFMMGLFRKAGHSVKLLHDAGVYHHDLNFGNLLVHGLDSGGGDPVVRIIDFDKSVVYKSLSRRKRSTNLARLLRHAVKNGIHRKENWRTLWRGFLSGYCIESGAAALLEEEVDLMLKRSLLFHRLSWRMQGK